MADGGAEVRARGLHDHDHAPGQVGQGLRRGAGGRDRPGERPPEQLLCRYHGAGGAGPAARPQGAGEGQVGARDGLRAAAAVGRPGGPGGGLPLPRGRGGDPRHCALPHRGRLPHPRVPPARHGPGRGGAGRGGLLGFPPGGLPPNGRPHRADVPPGARRQARRGAGAGGRAGGWAQGRGGGRRGGGGGGAVRAGGGQRRPPALPGDAAGVPGNVAAQPGTRRGASGGGDGTRQRRNRIC
mmetsp:Transcript_30928/g.98745  ORF Transcript_30928/g.98745 Transcript_30928/m.98745 type:complete len:240 (-) Transcript_30928:86-805(-)